MKRFNNYFNSAKPLLDIKQQLVEQKGILDHLRTCLPAPMSEHCLAAIPKNGDLMLLVDSPVWASRLRYLSTQLKQQLRKEKLVVRHIKVKVALPNHHTVKQKRMRRINPLSQANAKIISSVADCLDDHALKMALLRLSRHGTD